MQVLQQVLQRQVSVDEFDVVGQTKCINLFHQHVAVGFSLIGEYGGMRFSDDQKNSVRVHTNDIGQSPQGGFNAFSGTEQSKSRQHFPAGQIVFVLQQRFIQVGYQVGAVFDDHNFAFTYFVIGN